MLFDEKCSDETGAVEVKLIKNWSLLLALVFSLLGCQRSVINANQTPHVTIPDDVRCILAQSSHNPSDIDILQENTERGNTRCQVLLGDLYEHGIGVPQDIPHARSLYLLAAQTDVTANFYLGRLAEEGTGAPVDYRMARYYYKKSATGIGKIPSSLKLAPLLENGKGGPVDLQSAMDLYLDVGGSNAGARDGILRLYRLGAELSDSQRVGFFNSWASQSVSLLISQLSEQCHSLLKANPSAIELKPAKIQLKYVPGSLLAQIKLLESSTDKVFDQRLMQATYDYKFPYAPLPEPSGKPVNIITDIDPRSILCIVHL